MAMEELVVLKPQVLCLREEEQKVCVNNAFSCGLDARERKLVCVTGGNSNLGSHVVTWSESQFKTKVPYFSWQTFLACLPLI